MGRFAVRSGLENSKDPGVDGLPHTGYLVAPSSSEAIAMTTTLLPAQEEVLKAFSKQATHFDADDDANPVIKIWRKQVYQHVETFLKPSDRMLELNAGTGIDACYFAARGHWVHATDAAEGMIHELQKKISRNDFNGRLTSQQVSFEQLDKVNGSFHYIFSNFGGLNCIRDLGQVAQTIPGVLIPGGFITFVIMPPVAPWEWTWAFKGKFGDAFRRFSHDGAMAHLEGHRFKTYYHSLSKIQKTLGSRFKLVRSEGLGSISPPPASLAFERNFRRLSNLLRTIENNLKNTFPMNRWGDHIIITFKKSE